MITVLSKVLVIFAMIALGFLASKGGILPVESKKPLTDLLIIITTPCMIISSMVGRDMDAETRHETLLVILGSFLFFILAALVARILVQGFKATDVKDKGVLMVVMVAVNSGFMGFPLTKAAFGDHIFFLMVMQNIVLNIYIYLIAVIQLHYGDEEKLDFRGVARAASSPCVIAVIIGMIIMLMKWELPGPVYEFLETVGDATIPLSMIVVGVQLSESKFSSVVKNRDLVVSSIINVAVIPLLTLLCVHFLPIPNTVKITLVLASAFPCAVATVSVAVKEGKNSVLQAEGVALTTALSLITLPLIASLLQALYV